MSLNSNQSKELPLHPVECLWVSVLEISERLPNPKGACAFSVEASDCSWRASRPTAWLGILGFHSPLHCRHQFLVLFGRKQMKRFHILHSCLLELPCRQIHPGQPPMGFGILRSF